MVDELTMRAEEIEEHLQAQPFKSFRLHLTDGKSFDVPHPEFVLLTPHKLIIGMYERRGSHRIFEHIEHVSLLHVVRVEELQATPS
jgi:predicted RNA binding protein YcfA (HicA-like mRNA interferase family)